jgi:uncharacterized protein (TIGR03000 family)
MPRRLPYFALLLSFIVVLASWGNDDGKDESKQTPKGKGEPQPVGLKVLLPQANAKLTVEDKLTRQTGDVREFRSPPLDPSKRYVYTFIAEWEPNNYTRIKRKIKKTVSAGENVEVDMRKQDEAYPDDILVRYVPTPDDVVQEMLTLGKVKKDDVVFDLGCGDGRIVIAAVQAGAKRGVGIDIDPQRIKESKFNAKRVGVEDKLEFREQDVLKIPDLSEASLVMLYMGEDLNRQLRPILQKTLKPGSRVVSHRFTMGPEWTPDHTETYKGKDGDVYLIHLWTIKETKKDDGKKDDGKKENKDQKKEEKKDAKKEGGGKDK